MAGVIDKVVSAFKSVWDYIPNPIHWVFGEPWPVATEDEASDCEFCREFDKRIASLPDDLRELKMEKEYTLYNIKLDNVKPRHFKQLGRNLIYMAVTDPSYNRKPDGTYYEPDPPLPVEEPSDIMKKQELPDVFVNLKNINCLDLESLGEIFYELADFMEAALKDEKWPGYPNVPHTLDEPSWFHEYWDSVKFDPEKKVIEEMTEVKYLTLSDFVPGIPKVPYRSDADELVDYKTAYPPPKVDPEEILAEEKARDMPVLESTWMTHQFEDPYHPLQQKK